MRRRRELWLDEVVKEFPNMVLIWVYEEETRRGVFRPHFHVYLFLYEEFKYSEETMRERLLRPLFKRWHRINGRKLNQNANLLTWHEEGKRSINYVLKHVKLPRNNQKTKREKTWWGLRNHKAAKVNSTPGNDNRKGITKLASEWAEAHKKSESKKRIERRAKQLLRDRISTPVSESSLSYGWVGGRVEEYLEHLSHIATEKKVDRKPCNLGITSIEGTKGAIYDLSDVDNVRTLSDSPFPVCAMVEKPVEEQAANDLPLLEFPVPVTLASVSA